MIDISNRGKNPFPKQSITNTIEANLKLDKQKIFDAPIVLFPVLEISFFRTNFPKIKPVGIDPKK